MIFKFNNKFTIVHVKILKYSMKFYKEKNPTTTPPILLLTAFWWDNIPFEVERIKIEEPVRLFNRRKALNDIKNDLEGLDINLNEEHTCLFL